MWESYRIQGSGELLTNQFKVLLLKGHCKTSSWKNEWDQVQRGIEYQVRRLTETSRTV